jgi:hypothetical protein
MGVGSVMPHNGWNDFLVRIIDGTPIGLDAGLPLICELLADCGGLFATCRQGA